MIRYTIFLCGIAIASNRSELNNVKASFDIRKHDELTSRHKQHVFVLTDLVQPCFTVVHTMIAVGCKNIHDYMNLHTGWYNLQHNLPPTAACTVLMPRYTATQSTEKIMFTWRAHHTDKNDTVRQPARQNSYRSHLPASHRQHHTDSLFSILFQQLVSPTLNNLSNNDVIIDQYLKPGPAGPCIYHSAQMVQGKNTNYSHKNHLCTPSISQCSHFVLMFLIRND